MFEQITLREHIPMATTSPGDPSSDSDTKSYLWWRRNDQLFLGGLLCVLTLLLGMQALRLSGWFSRAEPLTLRPDNYFYTLNINTATWVEWAQLDGIGETLARRIVQDRHDHGPFTGIEDVNRVKGIGDKTMERIRPHLRLPTESSAKTEQNDSTRPKP